MAEDYTPSHLRSSDTRKTGNYSDYAQDPKSLYKTRGGARTFDSNKYSTEQHMYPDDLFSDRGEYGGNYAIFYINVSQDSKLIKNNMVETVEDSTPRDRGELIAKVNRDGNGEAMAIGGVAGTIGFAGIASAFAGGTFAAAGTGVVVGAGASAVATTVGDFKASQKRLKTAIALHMPNNMTIRYGVNYEEAETMMGQLVGSALGGSVSFAKAIQEKGLDDVKTNLTEDIAPGVTAAVLGNLPGSNIAQKLSGLAPNPKKEQIFRNVEVRTFQIDYQFFPRDEKEAENVRNIIKQFKLHMHPEYKDTNAFLYIYPSEFDIYYYNNTQENMNIHRHTSCVLTELTVNYTPQGRFNSFEGGMPSQVNMFLTFRELVPLTKERIEDGL